MGTLWFKNFLRFYSRILKGNFCKLFAKILENYAFFIDFWVFMCYALIISLNERR
jgi:hypothetical protein